MLLIFRSPQVEIDNPSLVKGWVVEEVLLPVVRVPEPDQTEEVCDDESLDNLLDNLDDIDGEAVIGNFVISVFDTV